MWKNKITLKPGEELKHEKSSTSGFMQETDVDIYAIVREDGSPGGSVKVEDHTAVKGFKRTVWVVQTDQDGKVIVDTRFSPD
jgi:hypothetical protein